VMLSGNDDSALGYLAHGGHGCISVTCILAQEQVSAFYNDAMAGQWQGALYGQDRLIRLHKALFADASPSPAKFALAHLGLCAEEARLPVAPCSEPARAAVLAGMHDAGVICHGWEADRREPPRAVRLLPRADVRGGPSAHRV